MPSVVVGFACPMKRLMSNGGIPAATHNLAYAWRREWNFSSGDNAAVGVSLLARNKRRGQADFSSAVDSQPLRRAARCTPSITDFRTHLVRSVSAEFASRARWMESAGLTRLRKGAGDESEGGRLPGGQGHDYRTA